MKTFALAGNPNSGKTTLFNALTGSTAHVGNWPGVTVDKKEGVYKKCKEPVKIVDLPGIYSLSPYTPEEVISRNYILNEKPDCIINIVDATNLERNLYLTTQLMETDIPVVIALNMTDEVKKRGDRIDESALEKITGLPVVGISALKGTNISRLMERAYEASQKGRKGKTVLENSVAIKRIKEYFELLLTKNVDNALFYAVKLAENDEIAIKEYEKIFEAAVDKDMDDGSFFEAKIADDRYKFISENYSPVYFRGEKNNENSLSKSDKADKILTHKLWGIPVFLIILFFIFHLTFSEDLLFLGAAGVFDKKAVAFDKAGNIIEVTKTDYDESYEYYDENGNRVTLVFADDGTLESVEAIPTVYLASGEKLLIDEAAEYPEGTKFYADEKVKREVEIVNNGDGYEIVFVSGIDEFLSGIDAHTFFGYEEGIYSPGVILANALNVLTELISVCVDEGLVKAAAAEWVSGLIVDGILGGLFAVLGFLPQILLLFLFFSILEDSGYMARVAFILDRIFRKFGLSGRAFMPMIMGFGCSVPAFANTRTLADENERVATIRVIPFFSCGAKLPILTAIAGGIAAMTGLKNPDVITYCMYVLGVVVAIASVLLMRNTTMKGEIPPFIMELPSYHLPQPKNLALHLWDKAKHFVKKAFTIILASTIVIWFISHFDKNWNYLEDIAVNNSILAGIGGLISPLFTPLGFGSQLSEWGWVFVVAAITGLIAKENVIATLGTLAACIAGSVIDVEIDGGVGAVSAMINATGITVPALLAFIAFNMTTIPCFAAVATAKAELPTKKSFRNTLWFWILASYVVSMAIYVIGSWWWTAFIFAVVFAAVITVIVLDKKGIVDVARIAAKIKNKFRRRKNNECD